MAEPARVPIGVWIESPRGAQWANQGMTRLLGFIAEGFAERGRHVMRIVVTDEIRRAAEADFAELRAVAGRDYSFHSPRDIGQAARTFDELARFADAHVPVAAWLSLFPNQVGVRWLKAPVAAIFPDAIGLAFHDFSASSWAPDGPTVAWRERVRRNLAHVDRFITFSEHVARDQLQAFFGVSPDRIRVIPHAPPSLEGVLPFVGPGERSPESRGRAAGLLRRHVAAYGPGYLSDFPFEHARFAVLSTQDRVTKNLRVAVEAVEHLVRREHESFKIIMTAHLGQEDIWTPTGLLIQTKQLHLDALSMPNLPRDVHAALYHCAEVAIHTSVFEGGRGVFPYYEAISVGTPCLMAAGPHTSELLADAPELADCCFEPSDAHGLARLMLTVSRERAAVVARQRSVYQRLCARTWGDVADEYADAAISAAVREACKDALSKGEHHDPDQPATARARPWGK